MARSLGTKSIKIKNPRGRQQIIFGDESDLFSSIADYDIIFAVVDERVYSFPKTKQLLKKISQNHQKIITTTVSINNFRKNTELLFELLNQMEKSNITRRSLLLSIGGGSTSDLVGVLAAFYMRGIDYVVIPTSFISMADTIISKVAVNHNSTKNLVGAFLSPVYTYIDIDFLQHANETNLFHGLVEILKLALIEHDTLILAEIEKILKGKKPTDLELLELIKWSIRVKAKYVVSDWYDVKGSHKALSLGHTLANYIEMNSQQHHAVAVLYGILLEFIIAYGRRIITRAQYDDFIKFIRLFEIKFTSSQEIMLLLDPVVVLPALQRDKISHSGIVKLVLPTKQGYAVSDVSEDELEGALVILNELEFF